MRLKAESIINLINEELTVSSDISKLILEYAKLKIKMDNFSEQNIYFRWAEESNKKKLEEIKDNFDRFKDDFNNSTIDELIEKTNEIELNILRYRDNTGMSKLLKTIAINKYSSDLCYVNELIELKSKINVIHEIDYYIDNPDEITILI